MLIVGSSISAERSALRATRKTGAYRTKKCRAAQVALRFWFNVELLSSRAHLLYDIFSGFQ